MVNNLDLDISLNVNDLKKTRESFTRFMMSYRFAVDEMLTKINTLSTEFSVLNDYNPIEHITSRVKSPESIMKKIERKGIEPDLNNIRRRIRDIAGIRITCSFVSNIYEISQMLQNQQDITVLDFKDYVKNPKPNGYRSVHLILQIPIYLSDRVEHVPVEVQIRTIAMDFWASLEHKIFYKYKQNVPARLLDELKNAATAAMELDLKMEGLNNEISEIKESNGSTDDLEALLPLQMFDKFFKANKE